jgi:hypothetical protein
MGPLPCTARTQAQKWAAPLEWQALQDRSTDEEQRFEVRVPERRTQPVKHLSQARKRVVQRERATFTCQSSHQLNQFVSSHLRSHVARYHTAVIPQTDGLGPASAEAMAQTAPPRTTMMEAAKRKAEQASSLILPKDANRPCLPPTRDAEPRRTSAL